MDHLTRADDADTARTWGFSHVVRRDGLLWCSGVMGTRDDGSVDPGPAAQFEQVFVRLAESLALAGAGLTDLVEITSYHVGLQQHVTLFAEVKARHLVAPYPAWTAVGVTELVLPGALVEVRAVASDPRA